MSPPTRSRVASSFTSIKGAMIYETYAVFAAWDFALSKRENLDRLHGVRQHLLHHAPHPACPIGQDDHCRCLLPARVAIDLVKDRAKRLTVGNLRVQ